MSDNTNDLEMNINGRINLAGFMLNYIVDDDGTIRIPTPGRPEAIGVLRNMTERFRAAGITALNGSVTTTPPPVTAGVTSTDPVTTAAKAPARRERATPATAAPAKNTLFNPGATSDTVAPAPAKRRGRPKGSGKKTKPTETAGAGA